MSERTYAAVDLGAGSGRVMLGRFNGATMSLEEVHRFQNGPMDLAGTLRWDFDRLFSDVKAGLRVAAKQTGGNIAAIGVDTWGVDYGLLDANGILISPPFNYRDSRTDTMLEAAYERVPKKVMFEQTGIQFMTINTVFQLLSAVIDKTQPLDQAETLLFIPDLVNYYLTGEKRAERTEASTSQCYNPVTKDWAREMLASLEIPDRIFPPFVDPGATLGTLTREVADETGLGGVPVIAVGSHDTASAVAAVPAASPDFAYLSSGTWSLMGIENPGPVINEQALAYNFTNEIGICDTVRFLKNINGLWLIQECKRVWAERGADRSYEEITRLAGAATAFSAAVDPDAAAFMGPGDMPARIREAAAANGDEIPDDPGVILRTALESLALKYRWVMEKLELLKGSSIGVLHIVGGGTQNRLLNQLTANAVQRPVVTGPVEATAAGNVMVQMMATGDLASHAEGRELVRASFETEHYEPVDGEAWDEAFEAYRGFIN
jgi:rhamnulokinase